MNFLHSSPVNGGPLSLLMTLGIPCTENICSNFGIVALAEVLCIGYRSRGGILVVLEPERSEGSKTTNILT